MTPYQIEDFFPHRGRMKLIDGIVEVNDQYCLTRAAASADWPLIRNQLINPLLTIELVAQTASIYVGWSKRRETRLGGKGFLVGIKKADWTGPWIPVGSDLRVKCSLVSHVENYGEFYGEVRSDTVIYGRVTVQTYQPTPEQMAALSPGAPPAPA